MFDVKFCFSLCQKRAKHIKLTLWQTNYLVVSKKSLIFAEPNEMKSNKKLNTI